MSPQEHQQNPTPANTNTNTNQDANQQAAPSPALSSEGYPSWLPKRPLHPAPASTIHSTAAANMLANAEADAGPSVALNEPVPAIPPLWGGRKPTPRSVRIVKTREPTDQTRVTATPRAWSRATGVGMSPTLVSQALRAARPRFRTPGLHVELLRDPSWRARLHFFLFPFFVFAHIPLQTFFDFNAAFVLVEIAKFPNPVATGVPGSGRGWALAAAAYVACWVIWLFGVFIGYELVYSFYRRWRYRRPLIMPLYLSAPAFNFVCTSSYANFCFFQHIRASAIPRVRANAILPSAEGSWRDVIAETSYFYSQNLPTVALLLPRAGITLAVLLNFWTPVELPGGLPLANVDSVVARRDGTFFDTQTGMLSGYAKGVLAASAAWAAWRILVLLVSWFGLWIFSGFGCVGFCGPATRWEEEEGVRVASVYSEKDVEANEIPWEWKECTALRVQEAYDFCLTVKRPQSTRKEFSEGTTGGPAFDGVDRVLAAVGLAGGAQQQPARRGVLTQDLYESPEDTQPPPTTADHTDAPYPFEGFGSDKEDSKEQVPFPPSPELENEEIDTEGYSEQHSPEPRTSHEITSSGRASNSLSSLGHPIPGRYPFTFRHPARGGSVSSAGAFSAGSYAHHTPQSKSSSSAGPSTGGSGLSRSTGNDESSDSPGGVGSSSGAPSPVGISSRIPMPPRHPTPGRNGRGRSGTVPLPTSPTPAYMPRERTRTHTTSFSTDANNSILYESELEEGVVGPLDLSGGEQQRSSSGSPSPESVLALEREGEDSVGLLTPNLSPKTSSSGLRSRHSSSNSSNSRSPRSRHGSHLTVSSASGSSGVRSRAQSLIHSIGSASRHSIDRVVRSRAQSLVRIEDLEERSSKSLERERAALSSPNDDNSPYMSEVSDRRVSSPENHTFGQRIIGASARVGRPRAPTESSEDPRSEAEASVSGSGSGESHQLRNVQSKVSSVTAHSERTAETEHEPKKPEHEAQAVAAPTTLPVPVPGVSQYPSSGMLSAAAPSFVTGPATISGQTDTSGRTPSSWGGDDYVHGSNFKPV